MNDRNLNRMSALEKSILVIEGLKSRIEELESLKYESIAIVGMSYRLPGGVKDSKSLWDLLSNGRDAISEIPSSRWGIKNHYGLDPDVPGEMNTYYGGFLPNIDKFDPLFFNISPREARSIDPQHRLLLEVSWEALEHAGEVVDKKKENNTGVFIGITLNEYRKIVNQSDSNKDLEKYGLTGEPLYAAAGRISYTFGFTGPSMSIDTACSSSLVAIHQACQSLRLKECDMALSGGVNLILTPDSMISTSKAGMLSSDGHCKTFDEKADGIGRSEACGMLVLKRLSDAKESGDNIIGIIKGSAVNQDGASSGFTVPNSRSQQAVIKKALKVSNIEPSQVSYIEAHGTGTLLGDPIELRSLENVFGNDSQRKNRLLVGSIKTNIGHTESSSGVIGVIKVLLQLQSKKIFPHINFDNPTTKFDWDKSVLTVPRGIMDWKVKEGCRIAGINSFGASGTNAHLVIEEPPVVESLTKDSCDEYTHTNIFTISAKTPQALDAQIENYIHFLSEDSSEVRNISYTANIGRSHFSNRLAIVFNNKEQMVKKLYKIRNRFIDEDLFLDNRKNNRDPNLAFIFSGRISKNIESLKKLFQRFSSFQDAIFKCEKIVNGYEKHTLVDQTSFSTQLNESTGEKFNALTEFSFAYSLACFWLSCGIVPRYVWGEGVGEYVAAVISGILTLEDALELVCLQSKIIYSRSDSEKDSLLSEYRDIDKNIELSKADIAFVPSRTLPPNNSFLLSEDDWNKGFQSFKAVEGIASLERNGCEILLLMGGAHLEEIFNTEKENPNRNVLLMPLQQNDIDFKTLYRIIASLYVKGFNINWTALYHKEKYEKMTIPYYPFQKKSYWAKSEIKKKNDITYLGDITELTESNKVYKTQWTQDFPSFVDNHKLFDEIVVAGASYISMLLSVAKGTIETDIYNLNDILFVKALSIAKNQSKSIEIRLHHGKENLYKCEVLSFASPNHHEDNKTLHVSGEISILPLMGNESDSQDFLNRDHLEKCLKNVISGTSFYDLMDNAGYRLGPMFKWIDCIWHEGNEALCRMIPQDGIEQYELHPGLIDSCFQMIGVLAGKDLLKDMKDEDFIYVPYFIHSVRYWSLVKQEELWCYFRKDNSYFGESKIVGDFFLLNKESEKVLEVIGIEVRRISKYSLLPKWSDPLLDKFYEIEWEKDNSVESYNINDINKHKKVLIISRSDLIVSSLEKACLEVGFDTISICLSNDSLWIDSNHCDLNPYDKSQIDAILHNNQDISNIVFIPSQKEELMRCSGEMLLEELHISSAAFLHLVQALYKEGLNANIAFHIFTHGSQNVNPDKYIANPFHSPLWGFAKSVIVEHPDLNLRMIDIDSSISFLENPSFILNEILSENQKFQKVYLDKSYYIPKLKKCDERSLRHNTNFAILPDCSYLITGGLGDLGFLFAQWLVLQGAKNLILTARTKASDEVNRKIEELRSQNIDVKIMLSDIGNEKDVISLIDEISKKSMPLKGIFHIAGIIDDVSVLDLDWETFQKVLKPKVQGSWYLHEYTKKIELDYFICFSSITAIIGNSFQANYSAGNSFMDSLISFRKGQGLPGLSINWGPWDKIGMFARLDEKYKRWLEMNGIKAIDQNDGLRAFEIILSSKKRNIGFVDIDWNVFVNKKKTWQPDFFHENLLQDSCLELPQYTDFWKQYQDSDVETKTKILNDSLTNIVSDVLNISKDEIDINETLLELGMDSLMALEIRNKANKILNIEIPIASVVSNISISDFAKEILSILSSSQQVNDNQYDLLSQDYVEGEI